MWIVVMSIIALAAIIGFLVLYVVNKEVDVDIPKQLDVPIWMLAIGGMALINTADKFFANPNDIHNTIIFAMGVLCIYTIPIQAAILLDHKDARRIAIINLLTGWSILGWMVALAWTLKK